MALWHYTKATDNRIGWGEHSGLGKAFFKIALKNFILLQLLFLGLFAYCFGSLYQQTEHTHNIHIAFVDYDGGAIGASVRAAYESLKGDNFPTLVAAAPDAFPVPADLRSAVCSTRYWGGLYVSANASSRLEDALGGGPPALAYDPSDVMTLIWNEARYSTVADTAVLSNMQTLAEAARVAYSRTDGTGRLRRITSPEAFTVLADPWKLRQDDLQPTSQGSRAIYNTLVIILILIQEFFYLGAINGLYANLKIYARVHPSRVMVIRFLLSAAYCLVGSVCVTGMIWAFRAGWDVGALQFGQSWMVLWLFAHLNFQVIDVFTIWLPVPYVPMALISWVIMNVTSILLPFELSPAFYRLGYLFPSHEVYQTLLDIWSRGCNPHLRYALPILFAWWLVSCALSALGVFRRSHYTMLAEEAQAKQSSERVTAALALERERDAKERRPQQQQQRSEKGADDGEAASTTGAGTMTSASASGVGDGAGPDDDDDDAERRLSRIITREAKEEQRLQRNLSRNCNFGPSFGVSVANEDSSDTDGRN
ncbi:uncharacterized protein PG986_001145 [Apiospora aurea]|uniref:DUF3533 domain-containing protein n=1 Tax=Apiospora aurea TaxID=335848 RepID=A0ABR1QW39_9PEZI